MEFDSFNGIMKTTSASELLTHSVEEPILTSSFDGKLH